MTLEGDESEPAEIRELRAELVRIVLDDLRARPDRPTLIKVDPTTLSALLVTWEAKLAPLIGDLAILNGEVARLHNRLDARESGPAIRDQTPLLAELLEEIRKLGRLIGPTGPESEAPSGTLELPPDPPDSADIDLTEAPPARVEGDRANPNAKKPILTRLRDDFKGRSFREQAVLSLIFGSVIAVILFGLIYIREYGFPEAGPELNLEAAPPRRIYIPSPPEPEGTNASEVTEPGAGANGLAARTPENQKARR